MEFECRVCLGYAETVTDVFSNDLPHKIKTISSVEISVDDRLPDKICSSCESNVYFLYDFCNLIRHSDIILHQRGIKQEDTYIREFETVEDLVLEPKIEAEEVRTLVNVETENKSATKVYKCKECDFSFRTYSMLRTHRKSHKEVVRIECTTCGKSVIKSYLNIHLRSHSITPISCEICGKIVKNISCLKAHMFIHNGKPLECPECGKIYKNRPRYYSHRRRHTLGDVKTIQCFMCNKLFFDKETLIKHIRSHTGERPYPCDYCKRGFSSRNALKTHIRLHTNEKPYVCEHCNMAFPQRVSLRTHLQTKHPHKTEAESNCA